MPELTLAAGPYVVTQSDLPVKCWANLYGIKATGYSAGQAAAACNATVDPDGVGLCEKHLSEYRGEVTVDQVLSEADA